MVFEQDPAARTTFEVITTYAGLHAVWSHLIAHKLYIIKTLRFGENDFTSISLLQELKFILEQKSENVYLLIMVWV